MDQERDHRARGEDPRIDAAAGTACAGERARRAGSGRGGGTDRPGGLLTGLTVIKTALGAELTDHLGNDKHDPAGCSGDNSRDGTRPKTALSDLGPVEIDIPRRDRAGTFEPVIVKKRRRRVDSINQIVLSLPARGLTTGGVSGHFAEVYGASVGKDTDSRSTDKVRGELGEWVFAAIGPLCPGRVPDAIVMKIP